MRKKVMEAAKKGDVVELHNLINNDPFVLSSVAICNGYNPLHMACMGGHVRFVKQVLNLSPEFVEEVNEDGLSPLHIASGRGDIEIVKEILKVGSHVCFLKGKEEKIALHYAVVKGRTQVIKELLKACEDSITQVSARGQSCLHLAVKVHQFESFKILLEHIVSFRKWDVLTKKDQQGNSILHLASFTKQYEVVDLLLNQSFDYKEKLELNSLNKKGQTPLDVLISEGGDSDIEEIFTLSGAKRGSEKMLVVTQNPPNNEQEQEGRRARPKSALQKLQDYYKYDKLKESPNKARNTLLVIAILIATATYQAVLSPPGGVWQDDYWPDSAKNSSSEKQPPAHTAGGPVMKTQSPVLYGLFKLFNSIGFFMSLHMMNFLTVGLPLQLELRTALFALVATYDTCMVANSPTEPISLLSIGLSILMVILMPVLSNLVRDRKWIRSWSL